MSKEEKAEIYRRADEFLRELVRNHPEVREMLNNAREEDNNYCRRLVPATDWMSGEA
jgi:hypothetical protein